MQIKNTSAQMSKNLYIKKDFGGEKKVDVNVLLNRVKFEKKGELKKNLIITAGAVGTLAITGLISFL